MRKAFFVWAVLAVGVVAFAAEEKERDGGKGVIVDKDGARKEVYHLKADSSGKLSFSADEAGKIKSSLVKERYLDAWLETTPRDVTRAAETFRKKDYAKAASQYEKAFDKYKYVGFGMECRVGQAIALGRSGDTDKAIRMLNALLKMKDKVNERSQKFWTNGLSELQKIYIDRKQYVEADRIGKVLARGVGGARPTEDEEANMIVNTAKMYMDRGMKKEAALMYMRVGLLFSVDTKARPEAMAETARILKEIGEPEWSEWAAMLKKEYPQSSYADKLK